MARRLLIGFLGLAYLVPVLLLLLWPRGATIKDLLVAVYYLGRNHFDVPPSVTPEDYADLANAVLLAPLTFLGVLMWRRRRWFPIAIVGIGAGVAAEVLQAVLGLGRVADGRDAFLNAIGALLGTALGVGVDWLLDRRRRRGTGGAPAAGQLPH